MSRRLEGFLTAAPDGSARLLDLDGRYTDVDSAEIVDDVRLDDHVSGLAVWRVDVSEGAVLRPGQLDQRAFDELFAIADPGCGAGVAPKPTSQPHCPATVPLIVCQETRHGPCV